MCFDQTHGLKIAGRKGRWDGETNSRFRVPSLGMLFVYYLLARHEEQRMLAKHGESYRQYMQQTAMFIPGEPGGEIFSVLFD